MNIEGKAWSLKIYVGESDKINNRLLFEEIVFEARNKGLAGATVTKGIMSYGASHSIHTMKIFALSGDLPIVIEIIDRKEVLDTFLETITSLLEKSKKGGLVTMQAIDVIKYQRGVKYQKEGSF